MGSRCSRRCLIVGCASGIAVTFPNSSLHLITCGCEPGMGHFGIDHFGQSVQAMGCLHPPCSACKRGDPKPRGLAPAQGRRRDPEGCDRDRVLSFGIQSETAANSLITVIMPKHWSLTEGLLQGLRKSFPFFVMGTKRLEILRVKNISGLS